MITRRPWLGLTGAVLAVTLSACGSEGKREPRPTGAGGMQHIHGLGVNGGTLFIATHTGLWVAPPGRVTVQRYGASRQDVMGFSIVDGRHFIGSGHPDPTQNRPPNLGLIESRDAGQHWTTVSLLGQADFHTLQSVSVGRRVYGFDGTQGRLMVSSDTGRTWRQRTPPGGVFSLAIDPRAPRRIVTSTDQGLFTSDTAGARFRPLAVRDQLAGLLAWPSADRLYLVNGAGQVLQSSDGGATWAVVGSIGGQPAAFISDGSDLYAALSDATVKRSNDGGRAWTIRARP